jgi:competence protein ComEC
MKIFPGVFVYISIVTILSFLTYHYFQVGIFVTVVFFHILHYKLHLKSFYILLASFFLALFYFHIQFEKSIETPSDQEQAMLISFAEYPSFDGNKLSGTVVDQQGKKLAFSFYGNTKRQMDKLKQILQPGITCHVIGKLELPPEPRNPNAFNYRQYLQTQKINYLFKAKSISDCSVGEKTVYHHLLHIRKTGIDRINEHFPAHIAPFINALLFGHDENIDPSVEEAYQTLGLSHLLAISGLHVTIISTFLYMILLKIGVTKEKVRLILLIFLPVYCVLGGAAPSVIRSVFMAWLILYLSKWRKLLSSVDALSISFIIYVLINPYIIYHVGFQLSYIVTAGLLLSKSLIQQIQGFFKNGLAVSIISQVISLPILLANFYEFSLISFLLNILFVPLYSIFVLPLSFIAYFLILSFPSLSGPFVSLLTFLIEYPNKFAVWINGFDHFSVVLGKPPTIIVILFFICIILCFILFEQFRFNKIKPILFIFICPFILQILFMKYSPIGEVTFIDVGQGDCIFIRLPFNQGNYLIDTGGVLSFAQEEWKKREKPFDPGESIVVPFLKSKGITKLDKLILTHGDIDHVGSSGVIFEHMQIDELIVGQTQEKSNAEQVIIKLARANQTKVTYAFNGLYWSQGKNQFFILAPEKNAKASNDASIVIYAKLGMKRWLFTGDIEKDGEEQLIQKYPNLQVDILKVGHHGSNTSTTDRFLKVVQPKVAVISVGENNLYGHPHKEVIERLEDDDIKTYRTDEHGAITFTYLFDIKKVKTMIQE